MRRYDFHLVEDSAIETIRTAMRLSANILLITNGSNTWIQASCKQYLPRLWPVIECLPLVSAKDMAVEQHKDPIEWKKVAFRDVLDRYFEERPSAVRVVVSIGDSLHEQLALFHYQRERPEVSVRSIKFIPMPDSARLALQHKALCQHLPDIMHLAQAWKTVDLRYFFTMTPSQTTEERVMELANRDLRENEDLQRGGPLPGNDDLHDIGSEHETVADDEETRLIYGPLSGGPSAKECSIYGSGDAAFGWVNGTSLQDQVLLLANERQLHASRRGDGDESPLAPLSARASSLSGDDTRSSVMGILLDSATKQWGKIFGPVQEEQITCWARRVSDGNPFLMLLDSF
ncbi:hypothetical protein GNI_077650 [Gregarina niphandrodes]|uniref:Uncharacterized protein n=1 Tax=Gregarina niphandrodes TaxID=110365 RepID=A0A023B6Q9_GRENI|nr:hypothetical protein GNI_077650 [Gregarina niphandrodes]EZG66676.1 hypothetical protein GNI_077650 [Gregarina niphandrodes]|eukprot:XP_011130527.1 hypothetical protein GNI_077650 [Gregarina niphandrodes]